MHEAVLLHCVESGELCYRGFCGGGKIIVDELAVDVLYCLFGRVKHIVGIETVIAQLIEKYLVGREIGAVGWEDLQQLVDGY